MTQPNPVRPPKELNPFMRIVRAFGYSIHGLKAMYRSEIAFRQELILAAICIPMSFVFHVTALERAVMVGCLFLVLIVEVLNTAFETTIERISGEYHPLSKLTKDMGSAAVFLSLVNMIVVWAIILIA
jgi:diacylglycerol kinase (ATP)